MKPYYEIDFSAVMCSFQIKINDVELISLSIEGQTRSDFPINHLILEGGKQTIEVKGLPMDGHQELHEDSYIRYRVNLYDMASGEYAFVKQFDEYFTKKPDKNIPFIGHASTFEADVPYKLEAWQNGMNLKDAKFDVKEKLIRKYNEIIKLINGGNYSSFIAQYQKRENNNAVAMYLSKSQAEGRMQSIISDMQNGYKAQSLPDDIQVEYSAFGKLAALKCTDMMSALRLENPESEEELVLPITFYIPEGKDEFEII
ncbi:MULTISPECIES: hypothetical protein [unclassified Chryseobacterium]|uniref:hypothetical protein n=1 Tax=unclassified Chryseobacterium TaxID=2593645 RepID=UPI0011D641E1|nr:MULTISPECIES: hypothetical protein [unclassified Chryseobacterium]QWT85844.1 hypothetical protein KBP46_20785 [Chryseobacterium sp. PCH239]TXI96827.1 MAG: hypothetical protein E6Q35_07125 [Chryseobacterium cucumeris]WFB69587.1 hypothetical protein PZ898_09165 [Chryseobacterium sp. WX]